MGYYDVNHWYSFVEIVMTINHRIFLIMSQGSVLERPLECFYLRGSLRVLEITEEAVRVLLEFHMFGLVTQPSLCKNI